MKKIASRYASLLWLLAALQSGSDADFFEKKIRPVLAERCASCHSASAGKHKGGLFLDSREGILKGGFGTSASVWAFTLNSDQREMITIRSNDYQHI